jgi:hypothetical protein
MTDPTGALVRIRKFVTEYAKMKGLDPEHVYGIQAGSEREAEIRISDLKTLLTLAESNQL